MACLVANTPVTVDPSIPYWRHVTYGASKSGWIAKKFLVVAPPMPPGSLPPDARLEIHFVDVGQGDAIWIHTIDDGVDGNGQYEGYDIVIDGGPYSADDQNPLLAYLESKGHHGARIQALMLTHPHTDHYRGAETVARHFEINDYYDPGYPSDLDGYKAFKQMMVGTASVPGRATRTHIGHANFGTLNWGSELKAEILYAYDSQFTGMGSGNTKVNNASIVLRLQFGQHVFLFMGDAEGKERNDSPDTPRYAEKVLLAHDPQKLKANVLKIAHHGSETSSTTPFLSAVDPDLVIVQSGRKSFSGTFLPDASLLHRLCAFKPSIQIYRTNAGDDAKTESQAADGDNIVVRSYGSTQLTIEAHDGASTQSPFACGP